MTIHVSGLKPGNRCWLFVIFLLRYLGINTGLMIIRDVTTLTWFPANKLYTKHVAPLLLLLFRHSGKSLNTQEGRLATSPYWLVIRFHLSHAIVMRWLHVRKSNVVILTPEASGFIGVLALAYPSIFQWILPGPRHRGLATMWTSFYLKGAGGLWFFKVGLHQLGSPSTLFLSRWTPQPCKFFGSTWHVTSSGFNS